MLALFTISRATRLFFKLPAGQHGFVLPVATVELVVVALIRLIVFFVFFIAVFK